MQINICHLKIEEFFNKVSFLLKQRKEKEKKRTMTPKIAIKVLNPEPDCDDDTYTSSSYVVTYEDGEVRCNGKKHMIDFDQHVDEGVKRESQELYENLLSDGCSEAVARVKAGLFLSFPDQEDGEESDQDDMVENPVLMEIRDQAILHLMGLIPELVKPTRDLEIIIKEEIFKQLCTGSSVACCDFEQLYKQLIVSAT